MHGLRLEETQHGLISEIEADHDQRGVVDQCRDDFGAHVSEGHHLIRGTARHAARGECNAERDRVAQIVDGVGHQRQAAGDNAADDLGDGEQHVHGDCPQDAPIAGLRTEMGIMLVTVSAHSVGL